VPYVKRIGSIGGGSSRGGAKQRLAQSQVGRAVSGAARREGEGEKKFPCVGEEKGERGKEGWGGGSFSKSFSLRRP